MTTSQQVNAGETLIIIIADTVTDTAGRWYHTNLNFGGRFGHSAVFHPIYGARQIDSAHEVALCIDRERSWHLKHGRQVRVEGSEYVNPHMLRREGRS